MFVAVHLSVVLNRDYSILQTITRAAPTANLTSCTELRLNSRQPCACHYDVCVGWYPCGLKYCRGKDSAGRIVSYRCGIKTCSRCRQFEMRVAGKSLCVWDEAEFQPVFVDSAPLHGVDDHLNVNGWNDGDAPRPRYFNETLLQRADVRNAGSVVDVGGADRIAKMQQRLVMARDGGHRGQLARASALDDDDDVD